MIAECVVVRLDGSVVRYVDFPPLHQSPMHRTTSIDYGFVLFGNVEVSDHLASPLNPFLGLMLLSLAQLVLSDGSTSLVSQGNLVVQRGTDHAWRNPSENEWASK